LWWVGCCAREKEGTIWVKVCRCVISEREDGKDLLGRRGGGGVDREGEAQRKYWSGGMRRRQGGLYAKGKGQGRCAPL